MNNHIHDFITMVTNNITMVTNNSGIALLTLVATGWCVALGFLAPSLKRDMGKNGVANAIAMICGHLFTMACFSFLIIAGFDVSVTMGYVSTGFVVLILLLSGCIARITLKLDNQPAKDPADLPADKYLLKVLETIDACITEAIGIPYFHMWNKDGIDGYTIFMKDGEVRGVINRSDYTTKPTVVRMGRINAHSNQTNDMPENLAYLCVMNINGMQCDLVLNYANGFDHMSEDGGLVRALRYHLLSVMKADPLLVKVILN